MIGTNFEQALRSEQPVARLRQLAVDLLGKGKAKGDVIAQFEKVRQELRTAEREEDEDAVTDVMDFLAGRCSPHMKVQPAGQDAARNGNPSEKTPSGSTAGK